MTRALKTIILLVEDKRVDFLAGCKVFLQSICEAKH